MKPITYWIQNDAINQLTSQYGDYLEKLSQNDRRLLIAFLAMSNVAENHLEFQLFLNEFQGTTPISCRLNAAIALVEPLNAYQKDLLIEAIAATLTHHDNPWLENARQNVAIVQAHAPQKRAPPLSNRDAHAV